MRINFCDHGPDRVKPFSIWKYVRSFQFLKITCYFSMKIEDIHKYDIFEIFTLAYCKWKIFKIWGVLEKPSFRTSCINKVLKSFWNKNFFTYAYRSQKNEQKY